MINSLSEDWLTVKHWAESELADLLAVLIATNNEEIRGRIKQLQDLLELPDIPA